ncbi:MAG: hypothetical protein INH40_06270, partial [Acidobacteriaceae bacterium]|nr:hypothetical protein [Acidobacteriaceae bacterium]
MKLALRVLTLLLAPAPLCAAYNYWLTDSFTSHNTNTWQINGPATPGPDGLHAPATPDASVILRTPVPDLSTNYEIRAQLRLPANGGSYVLYLRATPDARLNPDGAPAGQFFAFEIKDPTYANGACQATLNTWRALNNTLTQIGATTIPCYDNMEVRAVSTPHDIHFYLDDVAYVSHPETLLTTGQPGLGGFHMPAGNAIRRVDLGLLDRAAPTLAPASIATAVFDTRVALRWSPADDGPDGIGAAGYHLFRNDVYLGFRRAPEAVDLTAQPNTTYTYELQPEDLHGNKGPRSSITVITPPPGQRDPRRTGVRPLGTYWGGLGEQIDLQSGNVNFSMPLFKAQARGGWGVTFALSYNSQNWRRDTADLPRTWNHGRDTGYGYGWRFLAGALTPLYTDYRTIGMYRFLDSSGAEYRLTETAPNSGEWTSREGLFITYRSAEERLYFPDGTWWQFGSIAGASEMDAGTRYPTLFQDRNGNQIKVRYRPARGSTQPNSSGRIDEVEDVRNPAAYRCEYLNDALQHLNICRGIDANYQVGIGAPTPLTDPFLGQSFGEKQLLGGITNITDNINAPFYFGYDNGGTSGPGELTAAVFPYGGSLHWSYATGTLATGRQFRRVSARAYNANDGQGGKWAYLHFYPGPNAELPVHLWTVLQDPTLTADKAWWWDTNLASPVLGLNAGQADRKIPSQETVAHRSLAWSLTPNGNPYIAAVTEIVDEGHPDAKIRRTEQTIDNFGNLLAKREFAYGSTTAIAREHVYTYETAPAYINKFIRNLVKTVTLKRPGDADVLVLSNSYDQGNFLYEMPGATQHDPRFASLINGEWPRGNLTSTASLGTVRFFQYNTGGTVVSSFDQSGRVVSINPNSGRNYAVPAAVTANGITTTATFDAVLNLTQTTGANGATATFTWDGMRREKSQTFPSGAVINHTYGLGSAPGAS